MRGRLLDEDGTSKLGGLNLTDEELLTFDNIVITACGTSWHSALIGEHDDRGARAHSGRSRVRVGVPLSQSDRRRHDAVHRDLAVGRDGRHARGDARGEAPRRAHARHRERRRLDDRARGRRRHLPPRRPGDRRRVDQGVHEPGHRARCCSRSSSARLRDAVGRARPRDRRRRCAQLPGADPERSSIAPRRSRRSPRSSSARRISCTSAAATTSRSRSRARSSSRRSATSTPRAIRRRR